VDEEFLRETHRSIHLSCGGTMVFADSFPVRAFFLRNVLIISIMDKANC
jgi:hypothetical protein